MSRHLDTSIEAQMAKIMVQHWRSNRSSRKESVRSSSGRTIMGRQFEKVLLEHGWEKVLNWEWSFVNREKGLFLSMYVDDIKLAGKTKNIEPTWKILRKDENQHHFLTAYIWDALQESVKSLMKLWQTTKICPPDPEIISSWSYDMEGHAKKCVEICCELANKTTQQSHKVATPRMDDHHFKEEENESVGQLSTVFSQIVLTCLYLARIGRPDI